MSFENNYDLLFDNFSKLGGDIHALKQSLAFLENYSNSSFYKKDKNGLFGETKILNKNNLVIQDFTKPSSTKRLFLIDIDNSQVSAVFSSHGIGKDEELNDKVWAKYFSNTESSYLSPRGFFISGEKSISKLAWKWHMKLDGLQRDINCNSRLRYVVFHSGVKPKCVETRINTPGISHSNQEMISLEGPTQETTHGCTTVAKEYVDEFYEMTKNQTLFYNYTETEKDLPLLYLKRSDLLIKE